MQTLLSRVSNHGLFNAGLIHCHNSDDQQARHIRSNFSRSNLAEWHVLLDLFRQTVNPLKVDKHIFMGH